MASRRLLFILSLSVLLSSGLFSQSYRTAFTTERMMLPAGDYQTFGISAEFFLDDHWALNYSYLFGAGDNDRMFVRFPAAFLAFVTLFGEDFIYYGDEFAELAWLSFIVPEGISYHSLVRDWLEVSPFFLPFTSDYNLSLEDGFSAAMSFGFRAYIRPAGSIYLSPGLSMTKNYADGKTGEIVSMAVGFIW